MLYRVKKKDKFKKIAAYTLWSWNLTEIYYTGCSLSWNHSRYPVAAPRPKFLSLNPDHKSGQHVSQITPIMVRAMATLAYLSIYFTCQVLKFTFLHIQQDSGSASAALKRRTTHTAGSASAAPQQRTTCTARRSLGRNICSLW